MRITVIGTGYVGLVSGTCFAETGNSVVCVDIDTAKVEKLSQGQVTIFERGLDTLLNRNIKEGRLSFTTQLSEGIRQAEVIMLALPTPPGEDGSADLQYVLRVAEEIGPLLQHYTVVVNKSTVPVGTADLVREKIASRSKVEFDVVSNPEFLREGMAIDDFMKPDRVVIGTRSARAQKIMSHLYAPFVRQGNPVLIMDERSAELTKYAANAFLATKISYMNEVANLCELLGANVDMVRAGLGTDNRIGKQFLFAGIGYGGSCFPKDVRALAYSSQQAGYDFKILDAVMHVNQLQTTRMYNQMVEFFKGKLKDKKIAVWGLAFKPHTDDIREAPSLYNIRKMLEAGATVHVHDPEAIENVKALLGDAISYYSSPYQSLENAEALFIATEWPEYRNPDFSKMAELMKNKVIFDGRNLYDPAEIRELGFIYYSIGREIINP